VPPSLLKDLDNVHGARELQARADRVHAGVRLWNWSRITAWRNVCDVIGRRRAFRPPRDAEGAAARRRGRRPVQNGIPLNLVQRRLGHAQLSTTAIYADAVGPEEYAIAARMWATKT
jgi:integrase/recombinase XerD